MERKGPDALTLRAAAKEARAKSERSPMLYYPGGRVQLLALAAIGGFHDLNATLNDAPRAAEPVERLHELIRRYVAFGVARPNMYRAMFHRDLADPLQGRHNPASRKASETFEELGVLKLEAYNILVAPLERLEASRLRGHPRQLGLAVAALAHGLVGEYIDEGLWKHDEAGMRGGVTASVTEALLFGLLVGMPT